MEIQLEHPQQQQQQKVKIPLTKTSKRNARNKTANPINKYVGVRQRPSGRWVAEIKDTTQKIRMWLGTFETAEEAARAYDEAACLLRGSNTRTNFISTHVSGNSPITSRIRNLLNSKKNTATGANVTQNQQIIPNPQPSSSHDTGTSTTVNDTNSTLTTNTCAAESFPSSDDKIQDCSQLCDDDVYKPDMSNCCTNEFEVCSAQSGRACGGFDHGPDRFSFAQELSELPKNVIGLSENTDVELLEFERMKVERQISASLYALNGLQEYMEVLYDPTEALWDLPPLYPMLS